MAGPPRGAPGSGSSDPAGLRVLLLPWSGLEVLNGTAGAAVGSGSCSPSVLRKAQFAGRWRGVPVAEPRALLARAEVGEGPALPEPVPAGGRGRWSCPELGKPWLPGQQRGGDAPAAALLKAAALGARGAPRLGAPAAAGRELSRASLTLVTRAVDAEPGRRPARQLVALPASSAFHARFSAGPAVSHVSEDVGGLAGPGAGRALTGRPGLRAGCPAPPFPGIGTRRASLCSSPLLPFIR
ncbi:hypothetical protein J1605_018479 [Eschrichtius robustus]|uniref:Uncharacterized protein n=1 Tax=Eschrichtius robustus TaxID=9764 RepID=A0AB34HU30_ESCRO|nr:hypothetical protein J1605_018479 [Eschrichtius robustus]